MIHLPLLISRYLDPKIILQLVLGVQLQLDNKYTQYNHTPTHKRIFTK